MVVNNEGKIVSSRVNELKFTNIPGVFFDKIDGLCGKDVFCLTRELIDNIFR
jgi:hypothetical protein